MEPNLLIEYRCACGKLLFKGFMLVSVVEVKCKRCGKTKTFKDNMQGIRSFMLIVDGGGRIVDACEGVAVLECSRQYVIGKPLLDILPLARDARYQEITLVSHDNNNADIDKGTNSAAPSKSDAGGIYQVRNNTLLLRDRKLPIESHVVLAGSSKNGIDKSDSLYRIFNVIRET